MNKIRVALAQINTTFAGQDYFPLSAGLLQAYAQRHAKDPGRYEFMPLVYRREHVDRMLDRMRGADVAGFSTYVWNVNISLELARRLKKEQPATLIVFGGPQVPSNCEGFLRAHPWVDLACHGEGEETFSAILDQFPARDASGLSSVSYVDAKGEFNCNPRHHRMLHLDNVPSPYLDGVFDAIMRQGETKQWLGLWETNRGCPFACAFCEWGSSSLNRVHCFNMDRLAAEVNWFARHRVEFVFCCDSNFGLLERDWDIASAVVEAHRIHGYPKALSVQSTKNAVDRTYAIQKLLNDNGLSKGVLLALQSVHPPTLEYVRRRNIPLDTFDELQRRFARDGIATFTDLILGLPGETYDSFVSGVSDIIAKGQHNRIQFINLSILGNSEMGNLEYRKRHGFETVRTPAVHIHGARETAADGIEESQELVIATATMNRADWQRARVFSWMTAFAYFDKVLQLPMLLLHSIGGVSFRTMLEALADGHRGGPILAAILSSFKTRAEELQAGGPEYRHSQRWLDMWWPDDELALIELVADGRIDAFYAEAEQVLLDLASSAPQPPDATLVREAVALNRRMLKTPGHAEDLRIDLTYDIWSLYSDAREGRSSVPVRGRFAYRVKSSEERWDSVEDWCRRVIWYGNKKGAYLHSIARDAEVQGGGTSR